MRILLLNAGASVAAIAMLALGPAGDGRVAFLAPASQNAVEIVARAEGRLVALSDTGRIAVAVPDRAGMVGRLYAAGALVVFNPLLAAGCRSYTRSPP